MLSVKIIIRNLSNPLMIFGFLLLVKKEPPTFLFFKTLHFSIMFNQKALLKHLDLVRTKSKKKVEFVIRKNPRTKTWVVILKRRSGTLIIDTKDKRSSALMVKKILNSLVRK